MSEETKDAVDGGDDDNRPLVSVRDSDGNEVLALSTAEQFLMMEIINSEDTIATAMPLGTLFHIWYAEVFMSMHPMVDERAIEDMADNMEFIEGIFIDMYPQTKPLWAKLRHAFMEGMDRARKK